MYSDIMICVCTKETIFKDLQMFFFKDLQMLSWLFSLWFYKISYTSACDIKIQSHVSYHVVIIP